MAAKDRYGVAIRRFLDRVAGRGATTEQVIDAVLQSTDEDRLPARVDTGWGIRAALTRLYRKGQVGKIYEYLPMSYTRKDGSIVTHAYGKRTYRYFSRSHIPDGLLVSVEPLPAQRKEAPADRGRRLSKEEIELLQQKKNIETRRSK